jgi:hypothetical protein
VRELPVARGWEPLAAMSPTGSRYSSYNVFLLDPNYLALFGALQTTYRFFLQSTGLRSKPRFLQSWFNVHRYGQNLHRHLHDATLIGTVAARTEGSVTSYGPSPTADETDYRLPLLDGQLIVTTGRLHYHEVSVWHDEQNPRISYAFDIVEAKDWSSSQVLIPFDDGGDSASA